MRQDEPIRRGRDQRLYALCLLGTDSSVAATQLDRMEETLGAVCANSGCELIDFNGRGQHLHLARRIPPTTARSRLSGAFPRDFR